LSLLLPDEGKLLQLPMGLQVLEALLLHKENNRIENDTVGMLFETQISTSMLYVFKRLLIKDIRVAIT